MKKILSLTVTLSLFVFNFILFAKESVVVKLDKKERGQEVEQKGKGTSCLT